MASIRAVATRAISTRATRAWATGTITRRAVSSWAGPGRAIAALRWRATPLRTRATWPAVVAIPRTTIAGVALVIGIPIGARVLLHPVGHKFQIEIEG
jgi:hypothetical protein